MKSIRIIYITIYEGENIKRENLQRIGNLQHKDNHLNLIIFLYGLIWIEMEGFGPKEILVEVSLWSKLELWSHSGSTFSSDYRLNPNSNKGMHSTVLI